MFAPRRQRRTRTIAIGGGEIQNRRHRWSRDGKSSPWVGKSACAACRIQLGAKVAPLRLRRRSTIAIGGGVIKKESKRAGRDGQKSRWEGKLASTESPG